MTQVANAFPHKHFFLEMFTRDISLDACILDLIDNSIDGLIRSSGLDVSASILQTPKALTEAEQAKLPKIVVTYSTDQFSIVDECGGIGFEMAKKEIFTFGHDPKSTTKGNLGVYGIGLKRAIFKIGDDFSMESHTAADGFRVQVNLREWAKEDSKLSDWTFPLSPSPAAKHKSGRGTSITMKGLHAEVKQRIEDGTWATRLEKQIAQTYTYFLDRYVRIILNGKAVPPAKIPLGQSEEVALAMDAFTIDNVSVNIFAGLSVPKETKLENAGWYILCNARVIVAADKTAATGWGWGALPIFHAKYARFIGLAFFHSVDTLKLPWTTTKQGLNQESAIYQKARQRMGTAGRPITTFLGRMYPVDPPAAPQERVLAETVKAVDVRGLFSESNRTFSPKSPAAGKVKDTVPVRYNAKISDIEKIKKHMRRPSVKPNDIGEYTFEYYLKEEGLK